MLMDTITARLEVMSITLREIAATLPDAVAERCHERISVRLQGLLSDIDPEADIETDEAIAVEVAGLLGALQRLRS